MLVEGKVTDDPSCMLTMPLATPSTTTAELEELEVEAKVRKALMKIFDD